MLQSMYDVTRWFLFLPDHSERKVQKQRGQSCGAIEMPVNVNSRRVGPNSSKLSSFSSVFHQRVC